MEYHILGYLRSRGCNDSRGMCYRSFGAYYQPPTMILKARSILQQRRITSVRMSQAGGKKEANSTACMEAYMIMKTTNPLPMFLVLGLLRQAASHQYQAG